VTDHEAAKTDQVQIVILDALMRRKVFVNQAGPDPRHFGSLASIPSTVYRWYLYSRRSNVSGLVPLRISLAYATGIWSGSGRINHSA
jgi:hypothetical protein